MKTLKTINRILVSKTLTFIASLALAISAHAQSSMTWSINANGAKEVTAGGVPNQGDPDGTAIGTIELNNGTGGNTGFAVINLTLANLDTPFSAWHIHTGAANTTGSPIIDFGNPETLRSGNILSGTILSLSSASINTVFANSPGFYFNLHNNPPFPGGAVRDQLTVVVPEPASMTLAAIGLAAFGFRRAWRSRP